MTQLSKNLQRYNRMSSRLFYHSRNNSLNEVLKWANIAGSCAWYAHAGFYADHAVENELYKITPHLDSMPSSIKWSLPTAMDDGRRWLHILTTSYLAGGHTKLAEKWMLNAYENERHSFVLTDQGNFEIPSWLIDASSKTGGSYISFPSELEMFDKAKLLRDIALRWADVVVLHTHPDDPLAAAAFGASGGPPVIVVNHAGHVFWWGAGIADNVLELGTHERNLSLYRRDVRRSEVFPMPLTSKRIFASKRQLKQSLGISENAVVLLSIATSYKFVPYGVLNFPEVLLKIVNQYKEAVLIVIGPRPNEELWKVAIELSGGRIKVLGYQPDIASYYGAADIYLESFPIGSLTATLDAALIGIPIIPAPMPIAPFLVLDQYNGVPSNPNSLNEYMEMVGQFIQSGTLRQEVGIVQQEAVKKKHTGFFWDSNLKYIVDSLPKEHSVGNISREHSHNIEQDEGWAEMQLKYGSHNILLSKFNNL